MAKMKYNDEPFFSFVTYADMSDKPQINSVQLGDLSSEQLNIAWHGTKDEYKALATRNNECLYVIEKEPQTNIVIDTTEMAYDDYQRKEDFQLHTENKLIPNSINELVRNIGNTDSFTVGVKDTASQGVKEAVGYVGKQEDLASEYENIVDQLNCSYPGNKTQLKTTAKENMVAAVNEVDGNIGNVAQLQTTNKSSIVAGINELDSNIGNLANLKTTAKLSAVSAIDEIDGDVGSLNSLNTTAKTNLVAAENEIDKKIGNTANLKTSPGKDLVTAINAYVDQSDESKSLSFTMTMQKGPDYKDTWAYRNRLAQYIAPDIVYLQFQFVSADTLGQTNVFYEIAKNFTIDGRQVLSSNEMIYGFYSCYGENYMCKMRVWNKELQVSFPSYPLNGTTVYASGVMRLAAK